MTTQAEELKPFTVSTESEGLSDAERSFMRTGAVPEGFKPGDGTEVERVDNDPVITLPTDKTATTGADGLQVKTPVAGEGDGEPDDGEVQILDKNGKPHGNNGRFVSHKALYAEREEHKKTKGELATIREQMSAGTARLNLLYQLAGVDPTTGKKAGEAASTTSPLEEKDVAFTEDPIKAWDQMQRRQAFLVSQLNDRGKAMDGVNERIEAQNTNAATKTWLENDFRTFNTKEPTFGMAYHFVVDSLRKELAIGGMAAEEIETEINTKQQDFIRSSYAQKKSAAAMIFALAEARGWKKPEVTIGADGKPVLKAKGPAPGTQAATEKLAGVRKGQEASATLSSGGGTSGETLTLSQLAAMSEEDYAAVRKKLGKTGLKQYLGA